MKIKLSIIIIFMILGCDNIALSEEEDSKDNSDLLFSENFDNITDWTTEEIYKNWDLTAVPKGWTGSYASDRWSPSKGYPQSKTSGEILAANAMMAYGKKGKSYVNWREHNKDNSWHSDSVLIKKFDKDYKSLYLEFDIMFSEDMSSSYDNGELGFAKVARIYHGYYEKTSQMFSYHAGVQNPSLIWDLYGLPLDKQGYGIRNQLAFLTRRAPESYYKPFPEGALSGGAHSASYISDSRGTMPGGRDPKLINKVTGGDLHDEAAADFREVFGNGGTWTKISLYVEMNTSPGVHDGVFAQWLDGQRIYFRDDVAWIDKDRDMVGWNTIGIGGNDFVNSKDSSLQYEEWFSIDNVIVRKTAPSHLSVKR